MDLRQLTPDLAVTPQIQPEDLPALAEAGFRVLINTRPDSEVGPGEDDAAIGDHLQCPGAPAARLLQVDGEDADAAQTGLMADEHEQADAGKQTAKYRGQQGIEAFETNEMRQGFGKNREQADRTKGLHGESPAEGTQPEGIKRQVDQEVEQAEGEPCGIVGEESDAGGAAGEQPGLPEKHDGQRKEQGAMSFGSDGLLLGSDVADKPFLPGGIWFMLACSRNYS